MVEPVRRPRPVLHPREAAREPVPPVLPPPADRPAHDRGEVSAAGARGPVVDGARPRPSVALHLRERGTPDLPGSVLLHGKGSISGNHSDPRLEAAKGEHYPSPTLNIAGVLPQGQRHQHRTVRIYSWNIGGKPVQDALKAIEVTKPDLRNLKACVRRARLQQTLLISNLPW